VRLMGKLLVLVALGVAYTAGGCAPPLTSGALVGTYRLEHRVGTKSHGVETLVLHANGTYSQTFVPSRGGTTMTNTNKWKYTDGTLWLVDALSVPEPILDIKQYPVERITTGFGVSAYGGISFCKDPDLDLYYRKVP